MIDFEIPVNFKYLCLIDIEDHCKHNAKNNSQIDKSQMLLHKKSRVLNEKKNTLISTHHAVAMIPQVLSTSSQGVGLTTKELVV